jgi:hypothetical protein
MSFFKAMKNLMQRKKIMEPNIQLNQMSNDETEKHEHKKRKEKSNQYTWTILLNLGKSFKFTTC